MIERPKGRARLSKVLRETQGTITVEEVSGILALDRSRSAKLLARWVNQGWLKRLRRGLYAPIRLDEPSGRTVPNPWRLVPALMAPGYIGGWSAAEHWDLTEQLFSDICVFTARKFRGKVQEIEGTRFVLNQVSADRWFGIVGIWDGPAKIELSDKHRTIVDMLARPDTGAGMRHVASCVREYVAAADADLDRVIQYGESMGNRTLFKRLGFLLEAWARTPAMLMHARGAFRRGIPN